MGFHPFPVEFPIVVSRVLAAVQAQQEPVVVIAATCTCGRKMKLTTPPTASSQIQKPVAWEWREYSNDPDDLGWGMWKPCSEREVNHHRRGKYCEVRELFTTPPAAVIPDGMVLVPKEPTEVMYMALLDVEEVDDAREDMRNLWQAMIAAAQEVT